MLSLSEVGVIPDTLCTLEWLAIALHALLVGCTVLPFFHEDPVDDELRDFFCCRRRGRGGSGKLSSGIQMKNACICGMHRDLCQLSIFYYKE